MQVAGNWGCMQRHPTTLPWPACACTAAPMPAGLAALRHLPRCSPAPLPPPAADANVVYSREIEVNLLISYFAVYADEASNPWPDITDSGIGLVRA